MDLNLNEQSFLVTGCSSGFGKAITEALCEQGAHVTGVARSQDKLAALHHRWPELFVPIQGDLTDETFLSRLCEHALTRSWHGLVLNAGGPPAMTASQTRMEHWDQAYASVFRWKAELVLRLFPGMQRNGYGRILFIESQSVKQPVAALALSNSMRAAVIGFAKSLSQDLARSGITVNALAPGPHDTPAIERVIAWRAANTGERIDEARKAMEAAVPAGRFGKAEELASLALWVLSEKSAFVTGQTISHDGGVIGGLFG